MNLNALILTNIYKAQYSSLLDLVTCERSLPIPPAVEDTLANWQSSKYLPGYWTSLPEWMSNNPEVMSHIEALSAVWLRYHFRFPRMIHAGIRAVLNYTGVSTRLWRLKTVYDPMSDVLLIQIYRKNGPLVREVCDSIILPPGATWGDLFSRIAEVGQKLGAVITELNQDPSAHETTG